MRHDTGGRHYASLHRDGDLDVWLLCWNTVDDTGWHDHDTSSGAVAVTRGAVVEANPRMGGDPVGADRRGRPVLRLRSRPHPPHVRRRRRLRLDPRVLPAAVADGPVLDQPVGVMRRMSVSYADELRPLD